MDRRESGNEVEGESLKTRNGLGRIRRCSADDVDGGGILVYKVHSMRAGLSRSREYITSDKLAVLIQKCARIFWVSVHGDR
jgi:hypothetical protein